MFLVLRPFRTERWPRSDSHWTSVWVLLWGLCCQVSCHTCGPGGPAGGPAAPGATSRQASLTSAHRWDWVIFQTPFFLPLWIVRCLRICPIKLRKVYSLPHRLRCYMLMWMRTHGVLKRGKETHFCRRKAVQLFQSRSPRTGWRSFLRIFRVEQNWLFFF